MKAKVMKRLTPWEEQQVTNHLQSLLDAITCPPPPGSTTATAVQEEEIVFVNNDEHRDELQLPLVASQPSSSSPLEANTAPAAPAAPSLDLDVLPELPFGFKWTTMADELRRREVRQMIRDDGNTMYELANGVDEDVWKYWKMWNFPENPYTTGNGDEDDDDDVRNDDDNIQQQQQQQQQDHNGHHGAEASTENGGGDDDDLSSVSTITSFGTATTTCDELSLSTAASDEHEHDDDEDDDQSDGENDDVQDDNDDNSCITTYSYDPRIEETLTRLRQLVEGSMTVVMAGMTIYSGAMAVKSVALAVACQPVVCAIVALTMLSRDGICRTSNNGFIHWFFMLTVVVQFMKLFGFVTEEDATSFEATTSTSTATATATGNDNDNDVEEVPTIVVVNVTDEEQE